MHLKVLRVLAKMTQAEAASATGVNQATISDWERGEYRPSKAAQEKLAEAYGVGLDEIEQAVEEAVGK